MTQLTLDLFPSNKNKGYGVKIIISTSPRLCSTILRARLFPGDLVPCARMRMKTEAGSTLMIVVVSVYDVARSESLQWDLPGL